jgi:hypothetical protein
MVHTIALAGISFGQHMVGIILRPYETYRRIVREGTVWELAYIAVLLGLYFATATLIKNPSFRPFLLTRQFVVLASATGCAYCTVVGLMAAIGRLLKSQGKLRGLALGWAYSLVPTLVWFWVTSFLYVLIPPPRTTSFLGIAFSVVYLLFSATVLFWKIILSYLTVRFALRFDFKKIALTGAIILPIMVIYSVGMYRLGIFRIPFI